MELLQYESRRKAQNRKAQRRYRRKQRERAGEPRKVAEPDIASPDTDCPTYGGAELGIIDSLPSFSNDAAQDGNFGSMTDEASGRAADGCLGASMPQVQANIYTKVVRLISDLTKVYCFGVEMELVCPDEELCRLLDSIQDKFMLSIHRAAASSGWEQG